MPRRKNPAEALLETVRRFFVGHGASSFGSAATGHAHEAVDGTIDCEECAAAHQLPGVDVEVPATSTEETPSLPEDPPSEKAEPETKVETEVVVVPAATPEPAKE